MRLSRPIKAGIVITALLLAAGAAYVFLLPGLSRANRAPSPLEVEVATWLLHHSVPERAERAANPLGPKIAQTDITAGRDLFRSKCEVCHAYDGGGKTEIGGNTFPRAPVLHQAALSMSDGEMFYHIRNGIRNTAMPAWHFPDRQVWQLVAYIRHLATIAPPKDEDIVAQQTASVLSAHYVGSKACQSCHQQIYARWSKTRMANIVRDPRVHPEALIPDLSKADPKIVNFTMKDIGFVYGSKWKQRYFRKVGDTYIPLTAQWNVATKKWSKYHVADNQDWWAIHYPDPKGDNSSRPTAPLCDGCHSVNFNIDTRQPIEWNVGCEACHGAGSNHVQNPKLFNILNPARQNYVQANDTCIQCHSQGQPLNNPIKGQYYDWPVGYHAGLKLADFWKLEPHKLGEHTFTHFPDGSAAKNRMQGNDFVQSLMYRRGVTCFNCHDPHGSDNDAMLRKPATEICASCHGINSQNGPHAVSLEAHTHHKPGSPGSRCVACHMPQVLPELPGGPFISNHTFHFVTPAKTDAMQIPNACNACHKDRDTTWAAAAIRTWNDRSPWRMNE
ncbi:MAG: cytochrome C [Alphaproteobacteria bacterium 64-11]|nr:c-type cytochrome [Alphaproteobacteria bacterium]OJU14052.1 MAG: cytochrome C [Alphaproteobacteria bacterium 64-11]